MGELIFQQMNIWRWHPPRIASIISAVIVGFFALVVWIVFSLLLSSAHFADVSWLDLKSPWLYSFKIALTTTFICALIAPLVAWASWQLKFTHRGLDHLMALPYCLPSVVVGAMMVLAFGNAGTINHLLYEQLNWLDSPLTFLYQDFSPLLGTIWMNLSLGVMLLIRQWKAIPSSYWAQAELMKWTSLMKLRWVIIPFSKTALLPWLSVVFLSCFNSFGLMLVLSGSPSATTIELATWQALYLEADWTTAASLMALQLASSSLIVGILWQALKSNHAHHHTTLQRIRVEDHTRSSGIKTATAWILWCLFLVFYLLPFLALILATGQFLLTSSIEHFYEILSSILTSSINALACSILSILIIVTVVPAQQRALGFKRPGIAIWLGAMMWLPAIVPSMVCSFALLSMSSRFDASALKPSGIWLIQALLAVPVVGSLYWSGWTTNLAPNFRIREELGLSSWKQWTRIELPAMWTWIATGAAVAASLSFSDVTIVSLLADSEHPPLTLLLHRLMGSYQFGEASFLVFILVSISTILFLLTARRLKGAFHDRM